MSMPPSPYRLLLVEDDPGDALLVEELLKDIPDLLYDLTWVTTMEQATTHVAAHHMDCVLLDLNLPDSHGVPALETMLQHAPLTAVVVLTGRTEPGHGTLAVAHGAQDYLVKGHVDPDRLARAVRYAVQRKHVEHTAVELRANRMRAQENARLERGLLPTPLLDPETCPVQATTRYLPSREQALLGGDFLDVVQRPDGTVEAVIGDVSGHGPDEAALGVALRIAWRTLVMAGHHGTELLRLLEQVLEAEKHNDYTFATCAALTVSSDASRATVHLAGHHEPVLIDARGSAQVLPAATGIALGMLPGHADWQPTHFNLPVGGALLLYTDGLIEGHTDTDERFGANGLCRALTAMNTLLPGEQMDRLLALTRDLDADRHNDDIAILHLARRQRCTRHRI
ncbi:PP2C family protein-serine/threonine phosphatase [Streptacidiphilus melanogenes]|uniref:PP2C family protein-serine/threonine phosphatase n=1 Tax=Streptacidiphilus melanogenes TaxID=411235 RepID=UPI0005A70361|nr:fused response regulator/phosphatase [Streptacidiphilus melanogenes]